MYSEADAAVARQWHDVMLANRLPL